MFTFFKVLRLFMGSDQRSALGLRLTSETAHTFFGPRWGSIFSRVCILWSPGDKLPLSNPGMEAEHSASVYPGFALVIVPDIITIAYTP